MKKDKDQLKELLKKLKTLSERGVGGEKDTAKKKFEKLLADNGLTERDLIDDEPRYYLFSYQGQLKLILLQQCIYKTLGAGSFQTYKTKGTRNKIGAYCTPAQKVEIDLDFQFYSALFDEEADALMTAFIAKQDIYPEDVPGKILDVSELSEEELKKWQKAERFKQNITKKKRAAGLLDDKKGKVI